MRKIFQNLGYRNWVFWWYFGFFTIVVVCFTVLVYVNIKLQKWDAFDFSISTLSEEMLEEVMDLRDDLVLNELDTIQWSNTNYDKFVSNLEQELIDESIDNKISDVGYVKIRNVITGRILYQSPEITDYNLKFIDPDESRWGYHHFEYITSAGDVNIGIGYSGMRIGKHYFVAVILPVGVSSFDIIDTGRCKKVAYQIRNSIERRADSLYVDGKTDLLNVLEEDNLWAYIYIFEENSILWSSRPEKMPDGYLLREDHNPDVFIPREVITKEFYYDIRDENDTRYRQYSLIYDAVPTYMYRVDLAVSIESITKSLYFLAASLIIGAALLIAIVWAGGYFLMRRALRPVDEIIHAVNDITSQNLDKRLPLPKLENEITRLVHTFNKLLNRLSESFNIQKSFIADASHELRTPLSVLMSDVETALKNSSKTSPVRQSLRNAVTEIDRMAGIVEDLNLLAKSDSERFSVSKKSIRLDDVLMSTISRCQALAVKNNNKLVIKKMEIVEYIGDEELLIRALSNLVDNASKYSKSGDTIEVSLYKENNIAKFTVRDYGVGIPNKSLKKIFDRFYRIDSSRSRDTGGSGLGLAITKWICEIHSGKISATSKPNEGSTFTIQLPL